jgi:hypothetical protein
MHFCKTHDFAEIEETVFHQQFSSSLPSQIFSVIFPNSQLSDLQFFRVYKAVAAEASSQSLISISFKHRGNYCWLLPQRHATYTYQEDSHEFKHMFSYINVRNEGCDK